MTQDTSLIACAVSMAVGTVFLLYSLWSYSTKDSVSHLIDVWWDANYTNTKQFNDNEKRRKQSKLLTKIGLLLLVGGFLTANFILSQ